MLIGGFNERNEPCLFATEPSGFSSQWKSTAIGKNSDKVKEYLVEKYKDNMSYDEAINFVLSSMLEYVESGSKNIEVAIMKSGEQMITVSDEDIDKISSSIEEERKKNEQKK